MIKVKLNELVDRPKGTTVTLQQIQYRLGTEQQYRKELRKMLMALAAEVRASVLPALKHYNAINDALVTDEKAWFISLKQVAEALQEAVSQLVRQILELEAKRHRKKFVESAKNSLGVDISAIVRDEDLEEYLRDMASRNALLIKSLSDDVVKQVELLVYESKVNGRSQRQLSALLQKKFKIAEVRANLIAVDQTNKLNSDLNRIRQTQVGVTEYKWSTSADERVRSLHRDLDGRVYKWGKPTGAENGLPPGQPIRCRCSARGIVEF